MLLEWTIGNFKAVADKTTLPLTPLTILAGANSSGKSTLLQSILVAAQTLGSSTNRRALILNGELVRLGFMDDVVHAGQQDLPLHLGFALQPPSPTTTYSVRAPRVVYREADPDAIRLAAQFSLHKPAATAAALARLDHLTLAYGSDTTITLKRVPMRKGLMTDLEAHPQWRVPAELRAQILDGHFDFATTLRSTEPAPQRLAKDYPSLCSVHHFVPDRLLEAYNAAVESTVTTLRTIATLLTTDHSRQADRPHIGGLVIASFQGKDGQELRTLLRKAVTTAISRPKAISDPRYQEFKKVELYLDQRESLAEWITDVRKQVTGAVRGEYATAVRYEASRLETAGSRTEALGSRNAPDEADLGLRTVELPTALTLASRYIVDFFDRRVRYLGPLRDDPRAIYALPAGPEMTDVGLKGEYTAAVLDQHHAQPVTYPAPNWPETGRVAHSAPLSAAVMAWLQAMDLVEAVSTRDRGKIGTELSVRSIGLDRDLDLTNVGVGVSQVLPTLVMALLAPAGSTLLLEQPELHLHPKVQATLGDFLIGLAALGKQCIVETHSEYLINRIRRRIAEAEGPSLNQLVTIYFVERARGVSRFRPLDTNEFGGILDWPIGFFDEGPTEAERIMDAAQKKRTKLLATRRAQLHK